MGGAASVSGEAQSGHFGLPSAWKHIGADGDNMAKLARQPLDRPWATVLAWPLAFCTNNRDAQRRRSGVVAAAGAVRDQRLIIKVADAIRPNHYFVPFA
jgi:hypothetical protein